MAITHVHARTGGCVSVNNWDFRSISNRKTTWFGWCYIWVVLGVTIVMESFNSYGIDFVSICNMWRFGETDHDICTYLLTAQDFWPIWNKYLQQFWSGGRPWCKWRHVIHNGSSTNAKGECPWCEKLTCIMQVGQGNKIDDIFLKFSISRYKSTFKAVIDVINHQLPLTYLMFG